MLRLARAAARLVPPGTIMPVLKGPARGSRWIVGAGNHAHWAGTFEPDKAGLMRDALAAGDVMLDVGAHAGFYTLLAARTVGPTGSVFSFEPLPRNIEYLHRHVSLNRLDNVRVVEAAVAERDGDAMFELGPNSYTGRMSSGGNQPVHSVSLDAFVEAEALEKVDLIKIDVEGGEVDVLQGARRVLEEKRPTVLVAAHSPELRAACRQVLEDADYDVVELDRPNELHGRPRPSPAAVSSG